MSKAISFKINANDFLAKVKNKKTDLRKLVEDEIKRFLVNVANDAKRLAPVDEGYLRNSIAFETNGLSGKVVVTANYAAYIEFGTKGFAQRYVSTLPADWQAYASQFRGGGGNFNQMLLHLMEWIKRKGIKAGSYNVTTRRRIGNKATKQKEDKQLAYAIAISILRKGIKAHPFLYQAFEKNKKELMIRLKNAA